LPEPLSTASSSSNINPQNTTRLIEGIDNVLNTELKFFSNARKRIDTCMNYTRPELAIALEQTNKAFLDAKGRSVVLRYITEITKDNISYCKELMTMVNELRHLDGIKGNFMLSETEYLAPIILFEKGKIASQIIYSNQKEIADQHQYMFDTLWNKAVSAEQRIKEIEEGVEHTETRVLKIKTEIFSYMKSIAENADEQSTCCSIGGMQLVHNYFFDEYKRIVDRSRGREKESKGVRWITSIDKDSINLVNVFLDSGMQVRHLKNLTHVDFAVDNKNFNATVDKMEGGKLMESLLISNEPAYVSHYNSVFGELWKNGIDAKERIKDIEQGLDLEYIEVIPSSAKAQERYLDIVKSASEEILWIFPTTNAFIRQDKMGAIPLAIQAARERNIKVKILVPANNVIEQKVQQLKEYCHSCQIDVKYIEQMSETKATILVIDRKASLVMELKDDTKLTFYEAIGLTTYSNSKAGVLSYVAIFENLWKQSDLYEQLKRHDKMQKEFINIAAHELRTPIQPIIGLSEVVLANTKNTEQARLLEVINRNAKRLHRLTEDILDVTKIETQSLNLNKEQFNLNEVITNAIEDLTTKKVFSSSSMKAKNPTIKLLNNQRAQDVSIYADKVRISQVVSNLLDNTVKFTKAAEGNITIMINKEGEGQNNNNQQVIVSIKDTGTGIDPEILPKLFTKFATKSQTGGTGLGLFICKGIIEAHGGRIWAENNKDGEKGATFYFTLPLSR
jgi:two-component system, OmpR family, sensor histidine kinase VicK